MTGKNKEMKKRFLHWCARRNDFYTEILGDGDKFTNGEVVMANLLILALLAAAGFLPGILDALLG